MKNSPKTPIIKSRDSLKRVLSKGVILLNVSEIVLLFIYSIAWSECKNWFTCSWNCVAHTVLSLIQNFVVGWIHNFLPSKLLPNVSMRVSMSGISTSYFSLKVFIVLANWEEKAEIPTSLDLW